MRWVLGGLAAATALLSVTPANAQLPNLLRREPEQVESVLAQVRANAFAERCNTPVEGIEEERLEGYDLVDLLVGAPTAVRHDVQLIDGRAHQLLTSLLDSISRVQPPPAGTVVSVHIEDSDFVDARQARAGEIIVTRGMVEALLQRPPERRLADMTFILAHEYAHVLLCHYNRQVAVSRNRRALRSAATLGLLAVAVGNSSATRTQTGLVVTTDQDAVGEDALALLAGLTLLRTANSSIVNPAWSRQQERDADQLAVELIDGLSWETTTEYVPELLTALRAADEASTRGFAELFAQVPAQTAGALALSLREQNQQSSFRDSMTVIGVRVGLEAFQQWRDNQLRHFHDSPRRRVAWLEPMRVFVSADETESQRTQVQVNSEFDNDNWGPHFDAAYQADANAPRLAEQAFTLFAAENNEAGCTVAEQALAANAEDVSALRACGQCEIHRGNLARARRHLDSAIAAEFARPEDFNYVLQLWLGAEQRDRVEHVLQAGSARYPERFYISHMYVLQHYGEIERIAEVAAACAASSIPQPLKDDCASTAQRLMQQAAQADAEGGGRSAQTAPVLRDN